MEDRELVRHILSGDQKSFEVLVEQNQRLVGHMVARLLDDELDREDAAQEIFVKVYQKIGEFQFESKLSTWIATIAYRHSINILKKNKRDPEKDEIMDHDAVFEDRSVEQKDLSGFVNECIMKMPVSYRSILTLYHLDGMSYPEIVEITGMPEGTVKNYLFRARKKLKDILEPIKNKEHLV